MKRSYLILLAAAAAIAVVLVLRRRQEQGQPLPWETSPGPVPGSGPSGFLAGILASGCQVAAAASGTSDGGRCAAGAGPASKFIGIAGGGLKKVGSTVFKGLKSLF